MKRDTREVDDKMNNNNDYDTSQENQTRDDGKIEIVADRKYRHFEPSGTGSDTGTYTVENEEDEDKLKLADKAVTSPCLEEDKGFRSEEIQTESSRWVSEWASKTTSMEVGCKLKFGTICQGLTLKEGFRKLTSVQAVALACF